MMTYLDRAQTERFAGAYFVTLTAAGHAAIAAGSMFRDWHLQQPVPLYFINEEDARRHALASGFGDGEYKLSRIPKSYRKPSAVDAYQFVMEAFLGGAA